MKDSKHRILILSALLVFSTGAMAASVYDATFTAHFVDDVGAVDDFETPFNTPPDLYFTMGIFGPGYPDEGTLQTFYQGSPESTTSWNFDDRSVTFRQEVESGEPDTYFFFALLDEDSSSDDDYLGDHWIHLSGTGSTTFQIEHNNNQAPGSVLNLIPANGTGEASNYRLAYSLEVSAVPVPAAIWLFGSALIGLTGLVRWGKRKGSEL